MVSLLTRAITVCLLALMGSTAAQADTLLVRAGYSEILFDATAGVPLRWVICADICTPDSAHRATLLDVDDGYLQVLLAEAVDGTADASYVASLDEQEDELRVVFSHASNRIVYKISKTRPDLMMQLPAGARLELATGAAFIPEQLSGFGQIYSRVNGVQVTADGQELFDDPDQGAIDLQMSAGSWTGFRSRYWTLLLQPMSGAVQAQLNMSQQDHPVLTAGAGAGAGAGAEVDQALEYRLYAGPIEWRALKNVAPELSEMLFAALWDFLRLLCFGMLLLLEWLQTITGSFGLAIVLLSLSNKVLMTPLTLLADRWQAEVNRQHSLLKPELDQIKLSFKGEEAHKRVLEVYKNHNVSQFYTFKSAAGFLIQIPVFIAAFDMLAENMALNEMAFLWVSDLAKPDRLVELPFVMPFFGGWLNLLPFLMTGLSSLAAWLQAEETLTDELQKQQSVRLYLMSAAFFVLFYTFPAGMVLYWTSSNLFHLIKVESARVLKR